ncbi:MAG: cache domain-containing protein [Treponema sp.]
MHGAFLSIIGLDIDLSGLTDFICTIRVGKTGYCMLIQNNGMILYDSNHEEFNFKYLKDIKEQALFGIESMNEMSQLVILSGKSQRMFVFPLSELDWKLIILYRRK